MEWFSSVNPDQFLIFALVLIRISGLVVTAPIFGDRAVPPRVRTLLAVGLAFLITPTQLNADIPQPANLLGFAMLAGGELLVGLTLGLGVMLLFSGAQIAGQLISHLSGMALADVFQPGLDSSIPVYSHLLYLVSLTVFVLIDGHRMVMTGLLSAFTAVPPGSAGIPLSAAEAFTDLLTQSFIVGIRTAAPITVAQLLGTLVLGLISRTLPQLNVLVLGFGINALVTLSLVMFTLAGMVWVFDSQMEMMLEIAFDAVHLPWNPESLLP